MTWNEFAFLILFILLCTWLVLHGDRKNCWMLISMNTFCLQPVAWSLIGMFLVLTCIHTSVKPRLVASSHKIIKSYSYTFFGVKTRFWLCTSEESHFRFWIDLLHCLYFLPGLQWVYNSCGQLVEGTESYSSYSSQRNRKNGHYNTQEVCCHWNAIETEHLWSSNDSKVKVPWCQVIIMNKLCPLPCTCFLLLICVLFSFI